VTYPVVAAADSEIGRQWTAVRRTSGSLQRR